jgi:hypothetical protein
MRKLWLCGGFAIGLAGIFLTLPAHSQNTSPYLTGATIYISVDDWADIWLNDIQIVDSQPITPAAKGFQTIQCIPQHLCYFQRENILAIENADAYKVPQPTDDRVGLAYILRLRFSNGTQLTLSSNDLADHKAAYIPDRMEAEPRGWRRLDFDDGSWPEAQSTGTAIPNLALLTDPETNLAIQFLSATGISSRAQYPGERHLYRRKIFLDIGQNPYCASQTLAAVPVPVAPKMERVEPVPTATALPWLVPAPVPTPTPWVLLQWRPSPLPTQVPPSWPTATPTPVPPRPTIQTPQRRRKKVKLKPTPTLGFAPRVVAEPVVVNAPEVQEKALLSTPTASFTDETTGDQAQTIVFGVPPANIYISFADGPGVYRLEVFDNALHPLRNLFEQKIVAQADAWIEWDGKDDQGKDVPSGSYLAIYSKDGRELNKIIVVRSANP